MPTYEYVCEKCGKKFELFQRMSAAPVKVCPDESCKGPVKRLIGEGAGIIFKGHGFYCTDYKSSSTPSTGEHHHPHHEAAAKSAETSTASSGTESKTSSSEAKTPAAKSS